MRQLTLILSALGLAILPVAAVAAPPPPDPTAQFLAADTNKDGVVTREEFLAARARNFATVDKNGDGFISPDELAASLPGAQSQMMARFGFGQFDKNGDSKISKDEWKNGPTPMFDRLDKNRDSKVTRAELANAPQR